MYGTAGAATLWAREEVGGYDAAPPPEKEPLAGGDGAALSAELGGVDDGPLSGGPQLPPALTEAREQLEGALAALEGVELSAEPGEAVRTEAVALHRQVSRLQARLTDVVGEVDRRQAYVDDGAVSAQSWFRARVNCNPAEASRLVTASRRLRWLPWLAAAFSDGRVSLEHVTAITAAAVPQRRQAIEGLERSLVELAEHAQPRDVRVAVARIRDVEDGDGSDSEPLPDAGPDPRRSLSVRDSIDGLGEVDATLGALTTEWLRTLLDAFDEPDPPETPTDERRTPGQRRHDAFHAMLTRIGAHPDTPKLQGARPRVLAMVDMATLAGADTEATHTPRLRYAGEMTPELARELARDARVTAVQTMGPWRAVGVGRDQRSLPAWLREVMQMLHSTCRAPDCDRPATWSEAHHLEAWADGGPTDLANAVPTCTAHHRMVTHGGWSVRMDCDTLVCTWTSPSGKVVQTAPRPP